MPVPLRRLARRARLVARIGLQQSFRRYGFPVQPPLAMSFVTTDRCNSLCKTCDIGRRYLENPRLADGELTRGEYARIFSSIGGLTWLTFSGGEPFLRADFPDIVGDAAEQLRPLVINVPTNATLVRRTVEGVARILSRAGETQLVVNLSLDGIGPEHDRIRGFAGNFARLRSVMTELRAIADPRLTLGMNTVLSRFNADSAERIFDFVLDELAPDSYVVELAQIRPEYYNEGTEISADAETLRQALDAFALRQRGAARAGVPRLVRAFRHKYLADTRASLDAPAGHRCYAAFATCSVMPKGEVWSNTQRAESMGNLREHDLDFRALWTSPRAEQVRAQVRAGPCRCELSNAATVNSLLDPAALGRVLWYYARGA